MKIKTYPGTGYFDEEYETGENNVHIVVKDGKYGLLDADTRKLLVAPKYTRISSYNEGLASACGEDLKWGFINKSGRAIIPFVYEDASPFMNGIARVKINGKYGYLDNQNKGVIYPNYKHIDLFKDHVARACVDASNVKRMDNIFPQDRWYLINDFGDNLTPSGYDFIEYGNEGFFPVREKNKWGFINQYGKKITDVKFTAVKEFKNGFAPVCHNGKWGFINKFGEKVIPCRYDDVTLYFNNDIACVKLNGRAGCINPKGKVIVPCVLFGEVNDDPNEYELTMRTLKKIYTMKVDSVKSKTAKENLIKQFTKEKALLDSAFETCKNYVTTSIQKKEEQDQFRRDCLDVINGVEKQVEQPEEETKQVEVVENVPEQETTEQNFEQLEMPLEETNAGEQEKLVNKLANKTENKEVETEVEELYIGELDDSYFNDENSEETDEQLQQDDANTQTENEDEHSL